MKNKEEKIYTKANIKLSFLWVFLAFIIAIFGIFITYMYLTITFPSFLAL